MYAYMWECGVVAVVYTKKTLKSYKIPSSNQKHYARMYNVFSFKTLEQMITILDIIQG